ncbi:MAG TPA: hypothetical protein VGT79_04365, partial [Xanthomonadaceae bacterium]|nr:hypothetical protein [Xanthomonadaceae bacterium]
LVTTYWSSFASALLTRKRRGVVLADLRMHTPARDGSCGAASYVQRVAELAAELGQVLGAMTFSGKIDTELVVRIERAKGCAGTRMSPDRGTTTAYTGVANHRLGKS